MNLEIKCLECTQRTRHFEIGPAAYTPNGDQGILLRDNIICPKCKKDISEGKCITPSGIFMISLMAITMKMMAEKDDSHFELPPHLRNMAVVSKENYEFLKKQSKASIKLVAKLNNESKNEIK